MALSRVLLKKAFMVSHTNWGEAELLFILKNLSKAQLVESPWGKTLNQKAETRQLVLILGFILFSVNTIGEWSDQPLVKNWILETQERTESVPRDISVLDKVW